MPSEHQHAAWAETVRKACSNGQLLLLVEVGEDEIAAHDHLERAVRRARADVVGGDCHGLLEASAQAGERVPLYEGRPCASARAAPRGCLRGSRPGVRGPASRRLCRWRGCGSAATGTDRRARLPEGLRVSRAPAGRASGTPELKTARPALDRSSGERWEHFTRSRNATQCASAIAVFYGSRCRCFPMTGDVVRRMVVIPG